MKTDLELQTDVQAEINWEPMLNGSEIGVTANRGVITLTGMVDTFSKKDAAEKAAQRVSGVLGIAQEIQVELSSAHKRSDTEIAKAALDAFKWNTSIPEDALQVKVEKGWVEVTGQVQWQFQKNAARNCVEQLVGVKGVSDLIKIKPKVNAKVVKDNIVKALHRNASVEANNIKVETVSNNVILKGTVHSWYEKNQVEKAAWSAPGVNNVEDDLLVTG